MYLLYCQVGGERVVHAVITTLQACVDDTQQLLYFRKDKCKVIRCSCQFAGAERRVLRLHPDCRAGGAQPHPCQRTVPDQAQHLRCDPVGQRRVVGRSFGDCLRHVTHAGEQLRQLARVQRQLIR